MVPLRRPNSTSKRLRSQSSERIVVVSAPIGAHCRLRRGGLLTAESMLMAGPLDSYDDWADCRQGPLGLRWVTQSHHQVLKAAAWPQG